MFEQLDLFGGEASKPKETPKKKYALVPPKKVIEETIVPETDASSSKDNNPQDYVPKELILEATYTAEEIKITQNSIEEENTSTTQEKPDAGISSSNDASASSSINIPEDASLYSKQYYAISEVASMFNVNISLLRFWEKEFDILKPRKNRKGDRLFRPEDIKNLKLIYFLLREKRYTISGARTFIKKGKKVNEQFEAIETLKNIRKMLVELKESLS